MKYTKPYFITLFLISSLLSYAQFGGAIKEIGIGYGHYSELGVTKLNEASISSHTGISLSENYSNSNWFNHSRVVRSYDVTGSVRIKQSKNLRNELYFGGRVAGQFQHRTLFFGSKETIEEEYVDPTKPQYLNQVSNYNAIYLAEINDYILIAPTLYHRFILNDKISFNLGLTIGTLLPLRTGFQSSSFSGKIYRVIEDENVKSENWTYKSEIDYNWTSQTFIPKFRMQTEISLEYRPFERKPYYFNAAYLIGRSMEDALTQPYLFHGFRMGILSQF